MNKKLEKIMNKIMRRFGYVPFDETRDILFHMAMESVRRDGEMLETDDGFIKIKVAAKRWI